MLSPIFIRLAQQLFLIAVVDQLFGNNVTILNTHQTPLAPDGSGGYTTNTSHVIAGSTATRQFQLTELPLSLLHTGKIISSLQWQL